MELALLFLLVLAVPTALLLWTRRGRGHDEGPEGVDPQAHRDLGGGGRPLHSSGGDREWPSGSL